MRKNKPYVPLGLIDKWAFGLLWDLPQHFPSVQQADTYLTFLSLQNGLKIRKL